MRRETHSSRSGVAIALALVIVVALAWAGTECVLALLGQPALLVAPADAARAAIDIPNAVTAAGIIAVGALVAVLGLVAMLVAATPGRRARHVGVVERTAVVVDNAVIASSIARAASHAAGIDPDQVIVTVGRRTVSVYVRPTSGFRTDRGLIESAVRQQIDGMALTPSLRSQVTVEKNGKVGA